MENEKLKRLAEIQREEINELKQKLTETEYLNQMKSKEASELLKRITHMQTVQRQDFVDKNRI